MSFSGMTLEQASLYAADHDHLFEHVRRRGSSQPGIWLIPPISRAGQRADSLGALPQLGAEAAGMLIAVGNSVMYIVYRYNYDVRTSTGNWNSLYLQTNGELV
jgi:hypothetical protein